MILDSVTLWVSPIPLEVIPVLGLHNDIDPIVAEAGCLGSVLRCDSCCSTTLLI